jgi:ribose transport system ATP-binding protein
MPEVKAIADRVTVLKDGRLVGTHPAAALSVGDIVRMMVGRELADFFPPRPAGPPGPALLEIEGGGNGDLSDIDLVVRAGEIVGVAGLEGSGKSALARAIFGDAPFTRGAMRFEGRAIHPHSPRAGIDIGLGYLPDDRKREGLALQQTLRDNALMTLRAFAAALERPTGGAMSDEAADRQLRALDVRASRFDQEIRQLSGGNQQKVIVARWLARNPRLLIFAEPTRGIDVAAKAAIYRIMRDLAATGRGVLMISSDLPEIVGVSDRIVVMHQGRIVGECPGGATEEDVMALAVGHVPTEPEPRRALAS